MFYEIWQYSHPSIFTDKNILKIPCLRIHYKVMADNPQNLLQETGGDGGFSHIFGDKIRGQRFKIEKNNVLL